MLNSQYRQKYEQYQGNVSVSLDTVNKLVNHVFAAVNNELNDLENKGVNYEGYNGKAKEIYESVESFRSGDSSNPDVVYYNNVIGLEERVYKYYLEMYSSPRDYLSLNSDPPQCNYVKLMVLNNDSLFIRGLIMYSKLKNAENIMEQEYQNLNDTYDNLNKERTDLYNENEWLSSITDTKIPVEVKLRAHEYLPINDFAPDTIQGFLEKSNNESAQARAYHDEADSVHKSKEYEYLGKAYEDMMLANRFMNQSIMSLYDAQNASDVLIRTIKELYNEKKDECQSYSNSANENIKYILLNYLNTANDLAHDGSDSEETYNNYLSAYNQLKNCIDVAKSGKPKTYLGEDVLNELKEAIDNAKKDGLDVSSEEEWYNNNEGLNLSQEQLLMLSQTANNEIQSICSKAKSEYSDLPTLRSQIYDILIEISPYKSVTSSWDKYHKYDKYFDSSSIICPDALGHLSKIRKDYSSLLSSLNTKMSSALDNLLSSSSHYNIQVESNQTPIMDRPVHMTARIEVTNPTDLAGKAVHVKIPFDYEVYDSDVVNRTEGIGYISKTGSYLGFDISQVDPHKTYMLTLGWDELVCTSTKREDKITSADVSTAVGERTVTYSCERPVDRIFSYENLGTDFINVDCDSSSGIDVVNRTSIRLTLDNIAKGRGHKYTVFFYVGAPYNMSKGNVSSSETQGIIDVGYNIYVNDIKVKLKSLRVCINDEIGNSTSVSKFSIKPMTTAKATSVTYTVNNNILYYCFTIDTINPGEEYSYHVNYQVDNCEQYATMLYLALNSEIIGSGEQELIDKLNQAKEYLDSGECAKASKTLLELKDMYEQWSKQSGIDKEIFDNNIDDVNDTVNSLMDIAEILYTNNLTDEADQISERYNNSISMLNDALDYYNSGQYGEAVNSMYSASSNATIDLYTILSDARDRLSNERNSLWSSWISLGVENDSIVDLFGQVDDKLASLRSSRLSEDDLPLLGEISTMLDTIKEAIDSKSSGSVTELMKRIGYIQSMVNDDITPLLDDYKKVYCGLNKFKPKHAPMPVFTVKTSNVEKALSSSLKKLPELRSKLSDCDEECIRKTTGSLNELENDVNKTYSKLLMAMNNINRTIANNINTSEESIPHLKEKGKSTTQVTEYINDAQHALASGDMVKAFKDSSRAYDLVFDLLSSTTDENDFTVLIFGIVIIIGVGVLVYVFKRFMPIEKGKGKEGRDYGVLKRLGGIGGERRSERIEKREEIKKRRLRSYKYFKKRNQRNKD